MKILLACLLGFTIIHAFGQGLQNGNNEAEYKVRGHVKNVTETLYNRQPAASAQATGIMESREIKFNRLGKITESTLNSLLMQNSGETFLHKVFGYDKNGLLITCVNTKEYGLTTMDSFMCDDQGNVLIEMPLRPDMR